MKKINPAGELFPRKLSKEEISDPYVTIRRFFDYEDLPNIRKKLWDWLKITVTGTYSTGLFDKYKRYDFTHFFEHIEKLVEAAHLIHLQQKAKPKKKKIIKK